MRWLLVAVVAVTPLAITTYAPAGAASAPLIADWQMNEPAGATIMLDSSGNAITGTIGTGLSTGVVYQGATAYRWAFTSPTKPPAQPERLVLVWEDRLNPGSGNYAIELRYRTKQPFGNIVQKGQGGASGGYFKIENPNGILTCVFRGVGSDGSWKRKSVTSVNPLNDNQWHTVRCERTSTTLTLIVDGVVTKTANGSTGNIWNNRPISIAGKYNCDQVKTTCDYYTGDIDYIRIEAG
jgi:hypothetical protein